MAEWAMAGAALMSAYQGDESMEMQKEAKDEQKKAMAKATAEQAKADREAEVERLEGIAQNQTATDYGSIWGVKGSNVADAAQKLSAGTGSFDPDEDEENPFYVRGLI